VVGARKDGSMQKAVVAPCDHLLAAMREGG
jgi:hypothetical protein